MPKQLAHVDGLWARTTGQKVFNTMPRPLGLEIELAEWGDINRQTFRPKSFQYNIVHDGSVRPSGNEMVLSPLAGDNVITAMLELSKRLLVSKAKVNDTCGFHVHVAAKDLTPWDFQRFVKVYKALESDIYAVLLDPSRSDNRFCRPVDGELATAFAKMESATTTHAIKAALYKGCYDANVDHQRATVAALVEDRPRLPTVDEIDVLYPRHLHYRVAYACYTLNGDTLLRDFRRKLLTPEEAIAIRARIRYQPTEIISIMARVNTERARKYGGDGNDEPTRSGVIRYLGLNLHSWFHRGTIEFRMKEGTLDARELICWPLFCGWLVHLSTTLTTKQLNANSNLNLADFSRRYMPEFIANWVQDRITNQSKREAA